jgi:hypothetical protein
MRRGRSRESDGSRETDVILSSAKEATGKSQDKFAFRIVHLWQ